MATAAHCTLALPRISALAGILLAFASATFAQVAAKPWETKDWRDWTEAECRQVLENSPWATTIGSSAPGSPSVRIQFVSALPIRQAATRCALIKKKHDKRNAAQQASLEKQIGLHNFPEHQGQIVVRVEARMWVDLGGGVIPEVPGNSWDGSDYRPSQLYSYISWKYPETGDSAVLVLSNGTRVNPIARIPRKKSRTVDSVKQHEFTFPRTVNGHDINSPGYEITAVVLTGMRQPRGSAIFVMRGMPDYKGPWKFWLASFDGKDMTYKGRMEF